MTAMRIVVGFFFVGIACAEPGVVIGDGGTADASEQFADAAISDAAFGDAAVAHDASVPDAGGDDGGEISDAGRADAAHACESLDEARCRLTPECQADHCLVCDCEGHFEGCRGKDEPALQCPALGCIQPLCECHDLDEEACLAAASGFQCTPVYCDDCFSRQPFRSCAGPNELVGCPEIDCFPSCHSEADCENASCLPPDTHPGCGMCSEPQQTCLSDEECAEGFICVAPVCGCTGEQECVPGCSSAADCAAGEECRGDGHCAALSCAQASCPWPFVCNSEHECVRASCAGDGDCAGAYCVNGACYDGTGVCHPPVP